MDGLVTEVLGCILCRGVKGRFVTLGDGLFERCDYLWGFAD